MTKTGAETEQNYSGQRVCHFCGLDIDADEKVIQASTRNGWAHVTCWYDDGPFEREVRGLERRRS